MTTPRRCWVCHAAAPVTIFTSVLPWASSDAAGALGGRQNSNPRDTVSAEITR